MIASMVKGPLRQIRMAYHDWRAHNYITEKAKEIKDTHRTVFNFEKLKSKVSNFIKSLRVDSSGLRYRYSHSCSQPTLYASAYACMTLSLLGELHCLGNDKKNAWSKYFDSFQSHEDGLFYDPSVINKIYFDSDWWGARHLTVHMQSAYTDLCAKPRYPFHHLAKYQNKEYLKNWLNSFDWSSKALGFTDVDNKIMNIGCQLQFQRDTWNDDQAGETLDFLKGYLRGKIIRHTGLWGGFNTDDPEQRSRMVQFAYHLFPLFLYDGDFNFEHTRIVTHVLRTQNRHGGYGVRVNSSACEDIDSIDLLIRFSPYVSPTLVENIRASLMRAVDWVMLNQMDDGGFVFRLSEPFHYGSSQTSSLTNMGALFPTWFRTLSLAYLTKFLDLPQEFQITRSPGYEM